MLSRFSHVQFITIPWTIACQTSLAMGFSHQDYWSGWPCPLPGNLPDPGIEFVSPVLQVDSSSIESSRKPKNFIFHI